MADYFRVLKTIVKSSRDRVEDIHWLETLPQDDYLAAQDIVLDRLEAFLDEDVSLKQPALDALMLIDERTRPTVSALTQQYVQVISLAPEVDERLRQSVCRYYATLAKAYRRFLDLHRENPASFPHDLPQLILNILDCQCCLIKWHYFRQQVMGAGEWLQLHELYLLSETEGCAVHPLWRQRNWGETTITSTYLQVLLMGTLSPSDLLKHEVEMISGWLPELCQGARLIKQRIPSRRLFQVDLNEDRGGDWISRLPVQPSFRYWDTDELVSKVTKAHVDVQHGKPPSGVPLPPGVRVADCQPLLEYLLTEWSGAGYQRQRRAHPRSPISMTSMVIDGFESVCLYFKNVAYAQRKGHTSGDVDALAGKMLASPVALQVEGGSDVTDSPVAEWTLTNESRYGYGAVVPAAIASGLRLGRLLAFLGAQDQRFAVVGVVRNIKRLQDDRCYVAIEVIARRPVHVMLRNSDRKSGGWDPADQDIFLAATLAEGGGFPFGGMYLPKDEARNTPPALLIPALEYVAKGVFELRSEPYLYKVRLDRLIEQKDDWACVEARIIEKLSA